MTRVLQTQRVRTGEPGSAVVTGHVAGRLVVEPGWARRYGGLVPRGNQPKYLAIFNELRDRILDGRLAPGEQLPSQQGLAVEFDVTVMTLRQAIAELEAEGLIWVSRGRGSFVVDQPVKFRVGNLTSFTEQVRGQGLELETRLLSVGPVEGAFVDEAQAALGGEGELTEIGRLRLVAERPIVWQRTVLASSIVERLNEELLASQSLYELVAEVAGYRVARATESLRAVVLGPKEAATLAVAVGSPAMLSLRTSLTTDNTAFMYDRALLVGEAASVEADRHADRLELSYRVET